MKKQNTFDANVLLSMISLLFVLPFVGVSFLFSGVQDRPENKNEKGKLVSTGPDIILYNARVRTMDPSKPSAEAIAIKGNLLQAVGTDAEIRALQTTNTQMIDLGGRAVVPGLIDNHSHRLCNAFWNDGPEGLVRAAKEAAEEGYTTVHELYGDPGFVDAVAALVPENRLAVRINCYVPYNTNAGEDLTDWKHFPYTEKKDTLLRVVGIKVFADGGSVGWPALTTLYPNGEAAGTHGNLFKTQDEMDLAVAEILRAGYPIAMHAIGDSAIGVGLHAYSNAFAGQGNALRSRIEHLHVMRADLVDQMAALGVVAAIQYTFANTRSSWGQRVEPAVLEWFYPWRRMADRGIIIAGGNDYPYGKPSHAMQCISYLATRKVQRADVLPDWLDGDQLTVEEGLRGMTVTNAWVVFEEDVKATVSPGKLADLTVLSADPLSVDPFDVRYINVEMTMMDGIIRHNQIGILHTAVHDAGTFRMGVDDRGLWGPLRSLEGLVYRGAEHLRWGSLLVSYDSSTVAMALPEQNDYCVSANGSVQFNEPGTQATEQATVTYEDAAVFHPGKVRVTQMTSMWANDPLLLVHYAITNVGSNRLSGIYLGQLMDFDVVSRWTNKCGWDVKDGLGFCYIYNADDTTSPYIGMAMFDRSGRNVNTSMRFLSGYSRDVNGEPSLSELMRSGVIQPDASESADYAPLISAGPYEIDVNQSVAPFVLAIIVGNSVDDLKNGVQLAYQRSMLLTSVESVHNEPPSSPFLWQNYPNPFNARTIIRYSLPKASRVRLAVYDVLGREVALLADGSRDAGHHQVSFDGTFLSSGMYLCRLRTDGFVSSRKLLLIR
jgi:predicted amidohydrolase YtcJ